MTYQQIFLKIFIMSKNKLWRNILYTNDTVQVKLIFTLTKKENYIPFKNITGYSCYYFLRHI